MALLAAVALDNTSLCFDKAYDYIVPACLEEAAFEGARVFVPFGRSNSKRLGVILRLFKGDAQGKKELFSVLDQKRYLNEELLQLIPFLKNRYFCTYFDALKTVLPKGINYRTQAVYFALAEKQKDAENLQGEALRIYEYLLKKNTPVSEKSILSAFALTDNVAIHSLLRQGFILKDNRAERNHTDATEKMLKFLPSEEEYDTFKAKLPNKQRLVADLLKDVGTASLKEVMYFCAVTKVVADGLVKKGIALYYEQEVLQAPQAVQSDLARSDIRLNAVQQRAYDDIVLAREKEHKALCALLFGVTGSGKTQVYLKLIDRALEQGENAIVLVPEISLTPQTVAIFKQRFGESVAVFHSKLSVGQRMDAWKLVKENRVKIVVGTRSAIFAPFETLGLIIVDEEQEHTYKSEMSPRYDALEVAKFRCAYHKALLVLSSATPSVEDFSKAKSGTYLLAEIPERYGSAQLPEVQMVDMREQKNALGEQRIISDTLQQSLRENLQKGEQAILLLNRRGFNTFVSCTDCGEVVTCPHCSISMTYHRANNRLMCHFCGYSTILMSECPHCHSQSLALSGYGTQRIEKELEAAVPEARVLRMDADSTLKKLSHEQMLAAFSAGEYDIMVGTQMVAKGFDFPNVTLAAVVNADQALYNYDYRCSENTFDLVTQVVGRSGRGDKKGKAIIQTCTPDNPILKLAASQDYESFYRTEIAMRELMIYPPYCDLCLIAAISSSQTQAAKAIAHCFERLKQLNAGEYRDQKLMILGPAPAKLAKANNKYRYRLIIKCKNAPRFRAMVHETIVACMNDKQFKNTTVFADINPVDIM